MLLFWQRMHDSLGKNARQRCAQPIQKRLCIEPAIRETPCTNADIRVWRGYSHCPNGGGRSKAEAGMLKGMGVKAGVPDFVLPFPSSKWNGLAIELKSTDNVLTEKQRLWLQHAYSAGWVVGIARDLETYISMVQSFLNGTVFNQIPGFKEINCPPVALIKSLVVTLQSRLSFLLQFLPRIFFIGSC